MTVTEIVGVVLSSSVVAAIASGLFAKYRGDKEDYHKHITAERAKWRDAIRELAAKLPSSNRNKVKKVITQLVLYLNPYGKGSEADRYLKDEHIWRLIKEMGDMVDGKPESEIKKDLYDKSNLLKDYIALLLKYDWERSKREVRMNWATKVCFVAVIMALCILSGIQYYYYRCVNEYFYVGLFAFLFYPCLLGFLYAYKARSIKGIICRIVLTLFCAAYALVVVYAFYQSKGWNTSEIWMWGLPLFVSVFLMIIFIQIAVKNDVDSVYIDEIKRCMSRGSE